MSQNRNLQILFLAGDPSGDQHASMVIECLHKKSPFSECYGVGGPKMEAAGFSGLLPFTEFNRMGLTDVISNIAFFIRARRIIKKVIRTRKPDLLICVDFSGFNIPIMRFAHSLSIPVLWYISPKFWAWRKKKYIGNLTRFASHVATIFPFEEVQLKKHTPRVSFVGNPCVESMDRDGISPPILPDNLAQQSVIRLALVPGSRPSEIRHILPYMLSACKILVELYPGIIQITLSRCSHLPQTLFTDAGIEPNIFQSNQPLSHLLAQSHIAIVTSGTATLETALMGIPHVIVFKTLNITYKLLHPFLRKDLQFIGLPNIVAEEGIVPELVQDKLTANACAMELRRYIDDPVYYRKCSEKMRSLRNILGNKKPSSEVTDIILNLATSNTKIKQNNTNTSAC